jgi:hypothetical protein
MTTITLPYRFVEDHAARALPVGRVLRQTKREVTLMLDRAAWNDMLGDADYYAGFTGEDRKWNLGLCTSAAAVLRRMRAAEEPIATLTGTCPECREDIYDDTGRCEYCNAPGNLPAPETS